MQLFSSLLYRLTLLSSLPFIVPPPLSFDSHSIINNAMAEPEPDLPNAHRVPRSSSSPPGSNAHRARIAAESHMLTMCDFVVAARSNNTSTEVVVAVVSAQDRETPPYQYERTEEA